MKKKTTKTPADEGIEAAIKDAQMSSQTALKITALKQMRKAAEAFALAKISELAEFSNDSLLANDMIDAFTEAQIILYDSLDAALEELRSRK